MNKYNTPVVITIGQRSILAPKPFVFIGTGNRQSRYDAQLENYFMPMVMAAYNIEGSHRAVCQKAFNDFLNTGTYISEYAISDIVAAATLGHLAKLSNAIKTGIPYSVHLNYAQPRHIQLDIKKAIVEFVQKHHDFFSELYVSMYEPATKDAEEVKPAEETSGTA